MPLDMSLLRADNAYDHGDGWAIIHAFLFRRTWDPLGTGSAAYLPLKDTYIMQIGCRQFAVIIDQCNELVYWTEEGAPLTSWERKVLTKLELERILETLEDTTRFRSKIERKVVEGSRIYREQRIVFWMQRKNRQTVAAALESLYNLMD
jgi:hypothetical protein